MHWIGEISQESLHHIITTDWMDWISYSKKIPLSTLKWKKNSDNRNNKEWPSGSLTANKLHTLVNIMQILSFEKI